MCYKLWNSPIPRQRVQQGYSGKLSETKEKLRTKVYNFLLFFWICRCTWLARAWPCTSRSLRRQRINWSRNPFRSWSKTHCSHDNHELFNFFLFFQTQGGLDQLQYEGCTWRIPIPTVLPTLTGVPLANDYLTPRFTWCNSDINMFMFFFILFNNSENEKIKKEGIINFFQTYTKYSKLQILKTNTNN